MEGASMEDWNDNHIFTPMQKLYMLVCGIIICLAISYITFLYFEYRLVNGAWNTTFVSPKEFWSAVPEWEWKPIFKNFES